VGFGEWKLFEEKILLSLYFTSSHVVILPSVYYDYSSVIIFTRLLAGQPGNWGSVPFRGKIVFYELCRIAQGPTQPYVLWVVGVKWPSCEAD
jgi:hypothetical protein